jgi:hypothetical protein
MIFTIERRVGARLKDGLCCASYEFILITISCCGSFCICGHCAGSVPMAVRRYSISIFLGAWHSRLSC